MERKSSSFIWDLEKELDNICKHGIDFVTACKVFKDARRKIYIDSKHSKDEERFFCIGKVGDRILTVRFTPRQKATPVKAGMNGAGSGFAQANPAIKDATAVKPWSFTYRGYRIRIFGAGYWRKGEIYYEREDNGFK